MSDDHVLRPSEFGVKQFKPDRVYPKIGPDQYGQINNADADRSRLAEAGPLSSDSAHFRSDVDAHIKSLHHTLGLSRNQAASGAHSHDGITGKKIGPLEMDPGVAGATRAQLTITGAKGGNAALTSLIAYLANFFEFRDLTT